MLVVLQQQPSTLSKTEGLHRSWKKAPVHWALLSSLYKAFVSIAHILKLTLSKNCLLITEHKCARTYNIFKLLANSLILEAGKLAQSVIRLWHIRFNLTSFFLAHKKNPAYGRHQLSQRVRIIGSMRVQFGTTPRF